MDEQQRSPADMTYQEIMDEIDDLMRDERARQDSRYFDVTFWQRWKDLCLELSARAGERHHEPWP